MDFSVLSPDFKTQLEQQRDRLLSERDTIVQAALEQATTTIDANLAHINALLGHSDGSLQAEPSVLKPSTPAKQKKVTAEPIAKKASALKEPRASQATPEAKVAKPIARKEKPPKSTVSRVTKASRVTPTPSKSITTPPLKAEFKDMDLATAISIIFKRDSGRMFSVDNVIDTLYGPIDDALMGKSRQRIGVSLGHSLGREELVRVQDKPAIYRLNA